MLNYEYRTYLKISQLDHISLIKLSNWMPLFVGIVNITIHIIIIWFSKYAYMEKKLHSIIKENCRDMNSEFKIHWNISNLEGHDSFC